VRAALAMTRGVWHARGVVRALVVRELQSRYVGSSLGALWSVLPPLTQLAVFTFVFSVVLEVRFGATEHPFVLAFQETLTRGATCLVDQSVLVKRVVFPVEVLPLQLALAALVHQLIALALLVVLMALFGFPPTLALLALPAWLLVQLLLSVGCGWVVASCHVYFRDTAQALGVVLPVLFYLTPIIYPAHLIPEVLQPLLALNPLAALVEGYRDLFLEGVVPLGMREVWLLAVSVVVYAVGASVFARARGEFADLV
jgi:lipopolysaccharide transport system permease protein